MSDAWPLPGPQKRPPTLEPHLPLAAYRDVVDHQVDRRRPVALRALLFERDQARLGRGRRLPAAFDGFFRRTHTPAGATCRLARRHDPTRLGAMRTQTLAGTPVDSARRPLSS